LDHGTDIAIVGAGPSGSYAAWKLAVNGLQPLVLEEHPAPGYPEHCTGHIPVSLLEDLYPKPPPWLIQNRFRGMILHLPDKIELRIPFGNLNTCLIDRALFDEWLAGEAIRMGAAYSFSSRVEDASFKGGLIKVKVRDKKSNKDYILRTKMLIDGEGSPPRLLKKIGFTDASAIRFVDAVQGWFADVKDIERDFIEVYLTSTYAYPFYAWIAPIGGDSAKVGLAAAGEPFRKLMKFTGEDSRISYRFRDAYRSRLTGHRIPLGPPIFKSRGGITPVGDAAAHVKPVTGGGIASSLLFASILADAIIDAHPKIEQLHRVYPERVKGYVPYFRLMESMRNLLYSMEERKLSSIIRYSHGANMLPRLIEVAYPEARYSHRRFQTVKGWSLKWLLRVIPSLACSAPKPFLKLFYSAIPFMVRPLPPFKLHP